MTSRKRRLVVVAALASALAGGLPAGYAALEAPEASPTSTSTSASPAVHAEDASVATAQRSAPTVKHHRRRRPGRHPARRPGRHGLRLPPPGARWDYQLGGAYPPPPGVRVVERDRTAAPARGTYGICYVNGFQTQPQETSWWRDHHPGLLLRNGAGEEVADPGWPDEVLLDVRTPRNRAAVAAIEQGWLSGCRRAGYAAVEFDNLDLAGRSQGLVTNRDALAMAALLVRGAHRLGLAVAQKNAAELVTQGRRLGFDFAVVESCERYRECDAYVRGYGRRVLEVEYSDEGSEAFRRACSSRGRSISVVWRDRGLVARGRQGYAYASC